MATKKVAAKATAAKFTPFWEIKEKDVAKKKYFDLEDFFEFVDYMRRTYDKFLAGQDPGALSNIVQDLLSFRDVMRKFKDYSIKCDNYVFPHPKPTDMTFYFSLTTVESVLMRTYEKPFVLDGHLTRFLNYLIKLRNECLKVTGGLKAVSPQAVEHPAVTGEKPKKVPSVKGKPDIGAIIKVREKLKRGMKEEIEDDVLEEAKDVLSELHWAMPELELEDLSKILLKIYLDAEQGNWNVVKRDLLDLRKLLETRDIVFKKRKIVSGKDFSGVVFSTILSLVNLESAEAVKALKTIADEVKWWYDKLESQWRKKYLESVSVEEALKPHYVEMEEVIAWLDDIIYELERENYGKVKSDLMKLEKLLKGSLLTFRGEIVGRSDVIFADMFPVFYKALDEEPVKLLVVAKMLRSGLDEQMEKWERERKEKEDIQRKIAGNGAIEIEGLEEEVEPLHIDVNDFLEILNDIKAALKAKDYRRVEAEFRELEALLKRGDITYRGEVFVRGSVMHRDLFPLFYELLDNPGQLLQVIDVFKEQFIYLFEVWRRHEMLKRGSKTNGYVEERSLKYEL
jgi:hypothetical protein